MKQGRSASSCVGSIRHAAGGTSGRDARVENQRWAEECKLKYGTEGKSNTAGTRWLGSASCGSCCTVPDKA